MKLKKHNKHKYQAKMNGELLEDVVNLLMEELICIHREEMTKDKNCPTCCGITNI